MCILLIEGILHRVKSLKPAITIVAQATRIYKISMGSVEYIPIYPDISL